MFWGVTLESGKRYSQIVESSYHLSMAALEPNSREARKPNKHVSVMIEHGKTEFLLCTLEYDRVMQVALDLLFVEGEEVSFFLNGEGIVHLTGYVTDNEDKAIVISDQNDEESESISSDSDDESCSKLMTLDDEDESTGEEWTPEKAALKKKKGSLKIDNVTKIKAPEEKKSQKQSKDTSSSSLTASCTENVKKKEKPKGGDEDISLSSESDEEMEDESDDEEESDDEDEESELSGQDDEDDDDDDEESEEETDNEKSTPPPPTKKKKSLENNSLSSPAKSITESLKKSLNKTPLQNEVPKPSSSTPSISKGTEMSASKKKPEALDNKKKTETPFRKKSEGDSFHKSKVETPSNKTDNTPKTVNESSVSTGKKKRKKKRSLSEDNSSSFTETPKQDTPLMKLQNGIKVSDIKQGNGPQAKKGRFVHVCYVGRLNSGQEFDSARDRPFSFRLGCGEVIKGLDIGIEGMKVGGKRKLVIPPNQGYGSKKVGPIPPNSTLQFEVELKAVS